MVRILRSRDPFTYVTLQRGGRPSALGQQIAAAGDVAQLALLARMRVAAARSVAGRTTRDSNIPRS